MKNRFVALLVLLTSSLFASEGMWIPTLLNLDDMQAKGMSLSAEDIYSINHSSIKDAIVHFGGGCTGELISDQGLILTNYHCGYSRVQAHSSLENDYLTDGFWAMNKDEELSNPGLKVTFIKQIIDVTDKVLEGVFPTSTEEERNAIIQANSLLVVNDYIENTHYKGEVKAFNYGNEYHLIIKEIFTDIRLVGAPPSAIGKFGGDTDNWVWPRHTGDFSLFRIYSSPDGKPADFAAENIPFIPLHHLPINMDGVNEGDFTMVYGFPGSTYEHLVHKDVEYIMNQSNPMRIKMRRNSLAIIDAAMINVDATRIKYAAKQSRISNAYKKWIGQNLGLDSFEAIAKKKEFETDLQSKIENDTTLIEQYGSLINELNKMSIEGWDVHLARDIFVEFYYYGPEILRFSIGIDNLLAQMDTLEEGSEHYQLLVEKLNNKSNSFFKNYDKSIDEKIFESLWPIYYSENSNDYTVDISSIKGVSKSWNDGTTVAATLYSSSILLNKEGFLKEINSSIKKLKKKLDKDPIYQLSKLLYANYTDNIKGEYAMSKTRMDGLMRHYTFIQKELNNDPFWPDANSTLRVSYGKAEGSTPRDGMTYKYATTLDGIIQKNNTGNTDFTIPDKLRTLHSDKNYGKYTNEDGKISVCFLGSNHTSGGNSGSPAIDGNGYLVGLNFDRTWESTMSDIMYNPDICRNIMVDIRYVLFIIDKYADAGHLVDEMTLINVSESKEAEVIVL